MVRLLVFLGSAIIFPVFSRAADEFPPSGKFSLPPGQITATEFARQLETNSGLRVDLSAVDAGLMVPGDLKEASHWAALEHLARHTKSRLVMASGKVALKPGSERVAADLRGPFRFVPKEVSLRKDLATGGTICDLSLELAWLPGVHAYRVDASPKIDTVTDEAGNKYAVSPAGSRVFAGGTTAPLLVRPLGMKRASKSLDIAGSVQITVADELLTFGFTAAGKAIGEATQKGVSAVIRKTGNEGAHWYVELELTYPATSAVWESYEIYWARNNRLRLLPPGGEPIKADDVEFGDRTIRYLFKNRVGKVGADWKLDYVTPGPMRELRVPFALKGIELP